MAAQRADRGKWKELADKELRGKDADELVEWYKAEKPELSAEAQGIIGITLARKRMQDKYVSQIFDLYEDFHVTLMPLLDREVRGVPALESFSLGMLGVLPPPEA